MSTSLTLTSLFSLDVRYCCYVRWLWPASSCLIPLSYGALSSLSFSLMVVSVVVHSPGYHFFLRSEVRSNHETGQRPCLRSRWLLQTMTVCSLSQVEAVRLLLFVTVSSPWCPWSLRNLQLFPDMLQQPAPCPSFKYYTLVLHAYRFIFHKRNKLLNFTLCMYCSKQIIGVYILPYFRLFTLNIFNTHILGKRDTYDTGKFKNHLKA